MSEKVPPYQRNPPMWPLSPLSLRCDELDAAADLCGLDEYLRIAKADPTLVEGKDICFFEKPSRSFREGGGCSYYQGQLNAGSRASVLCSLAPHQLDDYIGVKYCEGGRCIYCPIWRASPDRGAQAGG